MVNNIRDIETDRRAGKRTLAVRLGRHRARRVFAAMVYLPFVWTMVVAIAAGESAAVLLMWLSFALAPGLVRTVASRTDGPSLNRALAQSGRLLAAFSVLLSRPGCSCAEWRSSASRWCRTRCRSGSRT